MYSLRKILPFVVCGLLLSGCSSLPDASWDDEEDPRETVYYAGDTVMDTGYAAMAREVSGGSVQIYSLDGPVQETMPPPVSERIGYSGGPRPAIMGEAFSGDPNVTVFPFEGAEYPVAPVPALRPPSNNTMRSPFGDLIELPPVTQRPFEPPAPALAPPVRSRQDMSSVHFKHGSSRLNGSDKKVIAAAAQSNASKITVDGHSSKRTEITDPVQSQIVNLEVSMDRALAVSSELIRRGVPVERIETRAFGNGHPVGDEAASRRVEIYTEGGSGLPVNVSADEETDSSPFSGQAVDLTEPSEDAPIPDLVRY
ncbi:MAG: OmpA family protein [Rhodospirillales bacterium]|nr:OmpA family protein [Rhodospirillales bacterium]MCB9995536.1 OmpA family protein [Rhodospirillales bacterium]